MSLKASISGIRGIIGESLTPDVAVNYVSAFSAILDDGPILIGRDSRPTGDMVTMLVKSVLNACGRDVVDIGIVPTPVVLFGVANDTFAGGIIITASHNPVEWNALKLVNGKGKFISPAEFEKLSALYREKQFSYKRYDGIGNNTLNTAIPVNHIEKIYSFIDNNKVAGKKYKVVLDAVNGAGGPHTIKFLEKTGCEVVPVNTEPTGLFAHPPEPTPANLGELSEVIRKNNADVGFALDPDADRLVIADENGNVLSEELTLALCVKHYLKQYNKTDVVINLSSSRVTEDVAEELGCKVFRAPTGEINVTEKMEAINALIGGEGNGGIILRDLNSCRDSLVGIALIIEMMAVENKSISELAKDLPSYVLVKEKISAVNVDFDDIKDKILNQFKDQKINTEDGIRIDFSDKWVSFRKSNTEPIIRIFAEAKTSEEAAELTGKIKSVIG